MNSKIPKVLHRVCGREMVSLVVDAARGAGFDATVVVVPPDASSIRTALGNGVSYAVQPEPLGSGHALLQARELLHGVDNVAVLHGDVPLIRPETLASIMRRHQDSRACITLLSATPRAPGDLGRVVRDASGRITAIVEFSQAGEEARSIAEVNGGIYCFSSSWLWPHLEGLGPSPRGEVFLTDLVALASQQGMVIESIQAHQPQEILGVNTRVHLAEAEAVLRQSLRERWMLFGVTLPDPGSVYIDYDVDLGRDTVLLPNTHISGASRIGRDCQIGPNTTISGSEIGDGCRITASVIESSTLEGGVDVGPFSHIRPGSHLESGVHIGNFAEVKQSRLGRGTKSGHFSFIGDADVGANVNIGAGTVTCNYDGTNKHRTRIEDDVFIGSDSMLVAPVTIGARSSTGAGSVVNRDVPPDSLAIGAPARVRAKKRSNNNN
jgi:bifunctional UDP-N-acetylglucosamine pyrophosphorylase/glucosamine-1-phosphate N-acetyltransferase